MGSLDVDSLFINIPLKKTINICTKSIYDQTDSVEGLNKCEFKELLSSAAKELYFIVNELLLTLSFDFLKPIFSGAYTHFDSFLPTTYKFSMIYTLAFRCFSIFPNCTNFHNELAFLKCIF